MRTKNRTATVYVDALERDVVVRGVPLLKLLYVAPGEPPIEREQLDQVRHPAYTRAIAAHVVKPELEPDVIDGLDDDTRFALLIAIMRAHPETRRVLRDETARAEREGL